MLACNRLRIDPGDGSLIAEYRIGSGWVEGRTFGSAEYGTTTDQRWERLTPEQLTSHVMEGTAVARWLRKRMGLHSLVRACTPSSNNEVEGLSERIAA